MHTGIKYFRFTSGILRVFAERPFLAGILFFILGIVLHAPFVLYDCFGEQDAARLAGRAVYGDLVGRLKMGGQWPFSYPLYIHMLYGLLRADLLSYGSVPQLMSLLSLFSSALFSAVFAVFIFRATRSFRVAIAAFAGLQLCPVFFLNSIYGFPTVTALCMFMAAAAAVQHGILFAKGHAASAVSFVAAAVLFLIGVLMKVDVLLAAALFLLPIWQASISGHKKILLAVGVFAVGVGSFWVLNRYGIALSKTGGATEHWTDWSKSFFAGFDMSASAENLSVLFSAAGAFSLPAALAAFGLCLVTKQHRALAGFIIAAALPIALFWSMMEGNSARHNLIPAVFAPFLAALPLDFKTKHLAAIWAGVLLAVFVTDYFWYPPSADTIEPSGRLIESAELLHSRRRKLKSFGRKIAALDNDKIFVLAPAHRMPLYHYEVITSDDMVFKKSSNIRVYMEKDGKTKTYIFPIKDPLSLLKKYKDKGYFIIRDPN